MKVKIYVWADGTWCYQDEIAKFSHKSDDYVSITVDEDYIEEAVEAFNRI